MGEKLSNKQNFRFKGGQKLLKNFTSQQMKHIQLQSPEGRKNSIKKIISDLQGMETIQKFPF